MTARRFVLIGTVASIATSAAIGSARAQDDDGTRPFGATRQVVVSLERTLGFTYGKTMVEERGNGLMLEEPGTAVGPFGAAGLTPRFAVPRLALDGFVGRRFSVGGAFGYTRQSAETNYSAATRGAVVITVPSTSTADALVLVARVGYLAPLSRTVSLWARVGFTYLRTTRTAPSVLYSRNLAQETFGLYALTLEAPIAVRIVDHVVVTGGPTLDLGLKGVMKRSDPDAPPVPNRPAREIDVGVSLGVAGYF
jgi:hypothetical protein